MLIGSYRQKTDEFFYDNYTRVWPGAQPQEMAEIYLGEMNALIYFFGLGEAYVQEFARDYRLAQRLKVLVDGVYRGVRLERSPYTIVPVKGLILWQKAGQTVYQCSYRKYFNILKYYTEQLRQLFPQQTAGKNWEERLEDLQKNRWHNQLESLGKKLRFWDRSPGNPESHFEGSKKLELNPGDIASFRQLQCQDTLRSLSVNGLVGVKDLAVLAEYKQLKCLYLRGMGIKDISFLSGLVNLEELGLPGNQIRDISPLAGLTKLNHLYIADNPVQDFTVVEQLPALKRLYTNLEQLPDQLAWEAIPDRIGLWVLKLTRLEKCKYHAEEVYVRKAAPKAKPKPVQEEKRLQIKDRWLYSGLTNALGHQPAVQYDLSKLKWLDCSDRITLCDDYTFLNEIGDYSCLAAATKLRELNLSGRVVNDFSWLTKCVNIQKLNLSGTSFADCRLLLELPRLQTVDLRQCPLQHQEVLNKLPLNVML